MNVHAVIVAYVDTLLWSECCRGTAPADVCDHNDGTPEDCDKSLQYLNYQSSDFTSDALAEITGDVTDFLISNADDLAGMDDAQIGHDFLLTRNHHGAGFWDRGLGERGDKLTAMSHPYGEMSAYVGDDGFIHVA